MMEGISPHLNNKPPKTFSFRVPQFISSFIPRNHEKVSNSYVNRMSSVKKKKKTFNNVRESMYVFKYINLSLTD